MNYVINIETSRGEGLVYIEDIEEEYPLYQRAYIPFVDEDAWAVDILGKSKTVETYRDWFYQRQSSRIVSVMLLPAFKEAPKYIDLSESIAFDLAIQNGMQCRIVMRDGIGELIGPGIAENRINLWVAKDMVYRAEIF